MKPSNSEPLTWQKWRSLWRATTDDIVRIGLLHGCYMIKNIALKEECELFRLFLAVADVRTQYSSEVKFKATSVFALNVIENKKGETDLYRLPRLSDQCHHALLHFLRSSKQVEDMLENHYLFRSLPNHLGGTLMELCKRWLVEDYFLDESLLRRSNTGQLHVALKWDRWETLDNMQRFLLSSHYPGSEKSFLKSIEAKIDKFDAGVIEVLEYFATDRYCQSLEHAYITGDPIALFLEQINHMKKLVVSRLKLIAFEQVEEELQSERTSLNV